MKAIHVFVFLLLSTPSTSFAQDEELDLTWDEMQLCRKTATSIGDLFTSMLMVSRSLKESSAPDYDALQALYFSQVNEIQEALSEFDDLIPKTVRDKVYSGVALVSAGGRFDEELIALGYQLSASGTTKVFSNALFSKDKDLLRSSSEFNDVCTSFYSRRNQ